uniref:Serum response factor-binding protein 1 n=1 Tax=Triatoma infestans TaxID=30076 RepID=A0A170YG37_TRIIF
MESLSRNKLRQEVQSMRPSIARGRIHLCRKIITDIKKLSKKKVNDQLKNEKNNRKIQRLTNEVHELKRLKPNSIAEFALSHTVESAKALRENPDISSRDRVLAKLSLHKLIKPLVETFHKSYPNWQELLPKLLDKNAVEIEATGNRSSTNEVNKIRKK